LDAISIVMNRLVFAARWVLGVLLLVGGINGFFMLVPVPEFHPFMALLVESGYLYVVKALEIVIAVLLLSNRYVILALSLLAPIAVNIALFHLFFDPRGWPMGAVVVVLTAFLMWTHRANFQSLLVAQPDNA